MRNSLCWKCDNAYGGCSWAQEFKPVDGWKATPTVIYDGDRAINSYHVEECPLFIWDKKFKPKKKEKREHVTWNTIAAILGYKWKEAIYRKPIETVRQMLEEKGVYLYYDEEIRKWFKKPLQ